MGGRLLTKQANLLEPRPMDYTRASSILKDSFGMAAWLQNLRLYRALGSYVCEITDMQSPPANSPNLQAVRAVPVDLVNGFRVGN